jgi:hypothetical protein
VARVGGAALEPSGFSLGVSKIGKQTALLLVLMAGRGGVLERNETAIKDPSRELYINSHENKNNYSNIWIVRVDHVTLSIIIVSPISQFVSNFTLGLFQYSYIFSCVQLT